MACFAIYTRQSTEPRDGFSTCEAQFQTCLQFANTQAGGGNKWIGERFDDEGVSGKTLNRPALNRLRERVKAGLIGLVYAAALDRYSRNVTDTIQLIEEFERAGVEVCLAHHVELCAEPESRLLRHILASFAQFEREMIASRIAETRAYLKKHGRRLPESRRALGFEVDISGCESNPHGSSRTPRPTLSESRFLWLTEPGG